MYTRNKTIRFELNDTFICQTKKKRIFMFHDLESFIRDDNIKYPKRNFESHVRKPRLKAI